MFVANAKKRREKLKKELVVERKFYFIERQKETSRAVIALRRAIAEVKQRWSVIGWATKNLLS
jgi:hypothetical protein